MSKKVIIIGGGPGGYVCAIRAAQLGFSVTVIDKSEHLGGTCLNCGCIPSKNLLHVSHEFYKTHHEHANLGLNTSCTADFEKIQANKKSVLKELGAGIQFLFKKNKITYIQGEASLESATTVVVNEKSYEADIIVLATGSLVRSLPGVTIDEDKILSSTGGLDMNVPPKTLAIIGGGYIGLELGSVWSRFGTKVTVVEDGPMITPSLDKDLAKALLENCKKEGIEFLLATRVQAVEVADNCTLKLLHNGENKTLEAEKVLISIGRVPNTQIIKNSTLNITLDDHGFVAVDNNFQTSVPGIYAIGDLINGPMLAHKAEEEGVVLMEKLVGLDNAEVNYHVIPAIVYTQPEIASVGFTENQLKDQGIDYKAFKFPLLANSRAKAVYETQGFVKLLAANDTLQILGGHICASQAGNMISEIAQVMQHRGTAHDIVETCHAHPTFSEAVKEAALGLMNRAIHV